MMSPQQPAGGNTSFSLLDEPWILCLTVEGQEQTLSIRDVFNHAQGISEIRGDSPAQDYAISRLLLAIYWRAAQAESARSFDFLDWFEDTYLAPESQNRLVQDYLDEYAERFDLLSQQTPFMQVADLHTEKNTSSPISRLVPEAEDEFFTMRAGQGRESLTFAEAARWLVYVQAYDYSGIKSGAVGDERAKNGKGYPIGTGWTGMTGGVLIHGTNFWQTLMLNTTSTALTSPNDRPVWERPADGAAARDVPGPGEKAQPTYPQGPADLATWQGRRVRLFVEDGHITNVLVSNGDRIPDAGANVFGDPMTPYRFSKNKSTKTNKVFYPRPHSEDRTMWTALEPLISLEDDPEYRGKTPGPRRPEILSQLASINEHEDLAEVADLSLTSVAYGPQSSSVRTSVTARINLPIDVLSPDAVELRSHLLSVADVTNQCAVKLGSYAGQLLVAAGGEYEFQAVQKDSFLAELEPLFNRWLGELRQHNAKSHVTAWHNTVYDQCVEAAQELLRGCGPQAIAGRVQDAEGSSPRLVSAATVYRWLIRELRETLFLLETGTKGTRNKK